MRVYGLAFLQQVLATAGHVCLYYMHVSTQQWVGRQGMLPRGWLCRHMVAWRSSSICHRLAPAFGIQTRKNVEGSLFLLKRRKAPRFQMMVLNKLATGESVRCERGFILAWCAIARPRCR